MNQHQFDILKTELLLTQGQMDKYDQAATTIKTWAVTLWVATTGWAIASSQPVVFLLGALMVAVFWFFESINKTFRHNYKRRRDEVAAILAHVFQNGSLPPDAISPRLPRQDLRHIFKHIIWVHIFLPYLTLILISIALFISH